MTTREDISHNQRVPGPLKVTVYHVDDDPTPPRDVELKATDAKGKDLTIVLWEKHGIRGSWTTGATYEITGGRGKRYEDTSGPDVVIDSNADFRIKRVEAGSGQTQLLVVGDTHIGYSNRPRSKKVSWHNELDCTETIYWIAKIAVEREVDAVVHAGDIFDHKVTESQLDEVDRALEWLRINGVPFYYVLGNHEPRKGRKLLEKYEDRYGTVKHLTLSRSEVNDNIALHGLDYHTKEDFPFDSISTSPRSQGGHDIMVVHQTLSPLHSDGEVHLDALVGTSNSKFDYIVCGHLHDAAQHAWKGTDVLYTGSVEKLSTKPNASTPSGWILSITEEGIETQRQPITNLNR